MAKRRKITTILKDTDIQLLDRLEDLITNIEINNTYNKLLLEYLEKDAMRNKDISDKDALLLYYKEKEENKRAYINLLDDMRAKHNQNIENINSMLAYLMQNIPKEILEDYEEE